MEIKNSSYKDEQKYLNEILDFIKEAKIGQYIGFGYIWAEKINETEVRNLNKWWSLNENEEFEIELFIEHFHNTDLKQIYVVEKEFINTIKEWNDKISKMKVGQYFKLFNRNHYKVSEKEWCLPIFNILDEMKYKVEKIEDFQIEDWFADCIGELNLKELKFEIH